MSHQILIRIIKKPLVRKIIGTLFLAAYVRSFLWISVLYLYGACYQPINDTFLESVIGFELFVFLFVPTTVFLISLVKSNNQMWLYFHDAIILMLLFPSFNLLLGSIGFEDAFYSATYTGLIITLILTLLTLFGIDWIKGNKKTSNIA